MAYVDLKTNTSYLFRFVLPIPFTNISKQDRATARYVTQKITGDLPAADFTRILQSIVKGSNTTGHYISYEGGSIEKTFFERESAQYICNLEEFVTPKYRDCIKKWPPPSKDSYQKILTSTATIFHQLPQNQITDHSMKSFTSQHGCPSTNHSPLSGKKISNTKTPEKSNNDTPEIPTIYHTPYIEM